MKEKPTVPETFRSDAQASGGSLETAPVNASKSERLIPESPKLRYISKALELLKPEAGAEGKTLRWKELYKKVGPAESMLELSDNIRAVVREYVAQKLTSVKKQTPPLKELQDRDLLDALANGWFEKLEEKISGQRRKVLLAVMGHVVRKIELHAYREILQRESGENLKKLGLDADTRGLLIEVMDASIKADPLFIRFLAYAQASKKPPQSASETSLFLPGDRKPHTLASLFPKETQFIAKHFESISRNSKSWIGRPGGMEFKEYLEVLAASYGEKDPEKASELQQKVQELYVRVIGSDFPILLSPATEGYVKEPYLDPELKVCLATPESKKTEDEFKQAQKVLADSLGELGVSRFSERMKSQKVRVVHALGSYGVNLVFNAVAQEKPAILLYLNEQVRTFDRKFHEYVGLVSNSRKEFKNLPPAERGALIESMSRKATMLHEFSHSIYPDDSPEAKRLGRRPLTTIDEVKAEIEYRPLVPSVIKRRGLEGTKEQWAVALLGNAVQVLAHEPPESSYFKAAVYCLNDLLGKRVVTFEGGELTINDFKSYWRTFKDLATRLNALYEDASMTEKKAAHWIKQNCTPNEKTKEVVEFIKQRVKT